jgi:hypothetical protein
MNDEITLWRQLRDVTGLPGIQYRVRSPTIEDCPLPRGCHSVFTVFNNTTGLKQEMYVVMLPPCDTLLFVCKLNHEFETVFCLDRDPCGNHTDFVSDGFAISIAYFLGMYERQRIKMALDLLLAALRDNIWVFMMPDPGTVAKPGY